MKSVEFKFPLKAGQLAANLNLELEGNPEDPIEGVCALENLERGVLSYWGHPKFKSLVESKQAGVVLASKKFTRKNQSLTYLLCENPKQSFIFLLKEITQRTKEPASISPQAIIHSSVVLGEGVSIGPFCVLEQGVKVGDGTEIQAFSYLGAKVTVGRDCLLYPRVTLMSGSRIGDQVKIFPGTVIGSDGFGFEGLEEIPQLGTVEVGSYSRIGALCTIDKATLGTTRLGENAKLDDHVHIGHNCEIGKRVILCAQTGIGGSSKIGNDVICGGQSGISDHGWVGDGAQLGAQTGAFHRLPGGKRYWQTPAVEIERALKIQRFLRKNSKGEG